MDPVECETLPCSKALRDAIICIGWLKLASVLWYMLVFFLTAAKSRGDMSVVLRDMLLAAAPLQVVHALLLFYSALEGRLVAVEASLWLCIALGTYNVVLGLMGCAYFIRTGQQDVHFVLVALYGMIVLSFFTVLCHDVLVIYAFKQVLVCQGKICPAAVDSYCE